MNDTNDISRHIKSYTTYNIINQSGLVILARAKLFAISGGKDFTVLETGARLPKIRENRRNMRAEVI